MNRLGMIISAAFFLSMILTALSYLFSRHSVSKTDFFNPGKKCKLSGPLWLAINILGWTLMILSMFLLLKSYH
jgi:hypothetical protein